MMNEEKFGLVVSAVLCENTWTLKEERTQSVSVTCINRLEAESVFA